MSHAAKEGAVIYSGAFVGVLLSDCVFYCSDVCEVNLCTSMLSIRSTQLSCHVKHLRSLSYYSIFPSCCAVCSLSAASLCPLAPSKIEYKKEVKKAKV